MQKKVETLSAEGDMLRAKIVQLELQLQQKQLTAQILPSIENYVGFSQSNTNKSGIAYTVEWNRVPSAIANTVLRQRIGTNITMERQQQGRIADTSVKIVGETVRKEEPPIAQQIGSDTEGRIYNKIVALIDIKDYQQAEVYAKRYLNVYAETQNSAVVLFWLGEIKMLFGDLREAKSCYLKALEQLKGKGRTPEVLMKIAVIAYQRGDNDEGDHYYKQLQKVYPGSTASHMARVQRKRYRIETD